MNLDSSLSSRLHIFHVISSISGSCEKARNYFALDLLAVDEASALFAAFSTVFHCLLALFSVVTAASSVSLDGVSGSLWSILHYRVIVHLLLIKSIVIVVLLLLNILSLHILLYRILYHCLYASKILPSFHRLGQDIHIIMNYYDLLLSR